MTPVESSSVPRPRLGWHAVVLVIVTTAIAGCTDDGSDSYNCYLAPDVPPVVVHEESATAATKKCEEEQGQPCTCTAIRSYRSIVAPE